MSVKNIGRSKWKVTVIIRLSTGGKKKKEATVHGTKLEAQEKEVELKKELSEFNKADSERSLTNRTKFNTFGECLEIYRERAQWKLTIWNRLYEHLAHVPLESSDSDDGIWEGLGSFVEHLKASTTKQGEPYSPAYINRHIAQAKAAVKLAYRPLRKIDINYLEGFPTEKENNIKYRILSNEERYRLHTELPDYLKPLFYFACRVPARVGELVNIKISDVDLNQGIISLEDGTTKNGEGRWLPIFPEIQRYLESLPKDVEYIFYRKINGVNQPLGYPCKKTGRIIANISKPWLEACNKADIEDYNFHKTRQQSAMQLLSEDWPEMQVMMVGGWKTYEAFRRYVHSSKTELLKRLGKWDADTSWMQELAPTG